MTYEEYENLAGTMTTENAPIIMKEVLENIKTDITALDAANTALAEKDLKIKDLQDTNIKLFLTQTGKGEQDDSLSEEEARQKENETVEQEIENLIKGV